MSFGDLEGEAGALYRSAGLDDGSPVRIQTLAKRLMGVSVTTVHAAKLRGDAALVVLHGKQCIYLRRGLPPERSGFAVAHELAHWALGLDSSSRENEEQCDALAACLVAPRRAFLSALREVGSSYTKLARWFVTSESCVALRFGEVTDTPLALVAPGAVRIRGTDFTWPNELGLRLMAEKSRAPGIRKARLSDDRRRVAMRSA